MRETGLVRAIAQVLDIAQSHHWVSLRGQGAGQMRILPRKVLMDEENAHWRR
jgi:hypothetical protein